MKILPLLRLTFLTSLLLLLQNSKSMSQETHRWRWIVQVPPTTVRVGAPSRTAGTGVRGNCSEEIRPRSFTPVMGVGRTMQQQFPIYFLIPESVEDSVSFTLLNARTKETLYETTATLDHTPTLLKMEVGSTDDPIRLEPRQNYQWILKVNCDPTGAVSVPSISGIVQYQPPEPSLAEELANLPVSDRPLALKEKGLTYDAIVALLELMKSEPDNEAIETTWEELLPQIPLDYGTPQCQDSKRVNLRSNLAD